MAWAALAGALLCLVLMAVRTASVFSFAEPLQLITSGDEQASLFAIWKKANGLPVYTDRFQAPFNAAFFNWLFYESYGAFARAMLGVGALGDAWLPTAARLFTALGALGVGLAAYGAFVVAADSRTRSLRALALAFAVYVAAGPLVGFWALTARPDVWALAFEAAAAAAFLALYDRSRMKAVLALAALSYAAWAFKQSSVFAAGAAGLFLLLRREWRPLVLLAAALAAAWSLTFALGGREYAKTILFADVPLSYAWHRMARNLANFAVKSGPSLLLVAALAMAVLGSRARIGAMARDDGVAFALAGAVVAAVVAITSSSHTGGSENYFFVLSFYLALLGLAGLGVAARQGGLAFERIAAAPAVGWATLIVAVALVLAGVTGVTDVRGQHAHYAAMKRCLDTLPRPLYVDDSYLALPWMTPGTEPFVLSYTYAADRALGRPFERDGIGGMIRTRHFAALAVPGAAPPATLDGAPLHGYISVPGACQGMSVFLRDAGGLPARPPAGPQQGT